MNNIKTVNLNDVRFNGSDYVPKNDDKRLSTQIYDIFILMSDGIYRTLFEISDITSYPQASVSAQLRHLRKERFGSNTVNKQHRGGKKSGLWEYQLIPNENSKIIFK